jgi:hypothetical protein
MPRRTPKPHQPQPPQPRAPAESDAAYTARHTARVEQLITSMAASESGLTASQLARVRRQLLQYAAVFDDRLPFQIPPTRLRHEILLKPGAQPKKRARYRFSPQKLQSLYAWRDQSLRDGFIEVYHPTGSPYNNSVLDVSTAPRTDNQIFSVRKKPPADQPEQKMEPRWVVDSTPLNSETVRDNIELPDTEDVFMALAGQTLFSCFDLLKGYWQIAMEPNSKKYVCFTIPGDPNTYTWTCLAMGLLNSAETLFRAVQKDFGDVQGLHIFRDDFVVSGSTFEELHARTEQLLSTALTHGWKLKFGKARVYQRSVHLLGRVVDAQGVHVDPVHAHAIAHSQKPATKRQLQGFLGMTGWHRKWIKGYAQLAAPLTAATRAEAPATVQWSPEMEAARKALIQAITSLPTIAHPDLTKPFIIETDASEHYMGAVLLQADDRGVEHPIAYWSKAIPAASMAWPIRRKEALPKKEALLLWEAWIDNGHPIVLRSDHQSLQYLPAERNDKVLLRMCDAISHLDVRHEYKKGAAMHVADFLSRSPPPPPPALLTGSVNAITAPVFDRDSLITAYDACPDTARILQRTAQGDNTYTQHSDGLITHTQSGAWLVAQPYRQDVLALLHGHPLTGHMGVDKTHARVKQHFTWPGLKADVEAYVGACLPCQLRKYPLDRHIGKQVARPTSPPMHDVSTDFFGPLPADVHGNTHVVTFVCNTTGYLELYPAAGATSAALITALDRFITTHGVPHTLRHDRGSNYMSADFKAHAAALGIKLLPTMALAPWSNAKAELVNKHIAQYLTQALQGTAKQQWTQHLDACRFAYNTSVHSSTQQTPFFLVHARHARMPFHNLLSLPPNDTPLRQSPLTRAAQLQDTLLRARHQAHAVQQRVQRREQRTEHLPQFVPGDLVTLWYGAANIAKATGDPKKLSNNRTGPHTVLARLSPYRYKIKALDSDATQEVHVKRLSGYTPLPPPTTALPVQDPPPPPPPAQPQPDTTVTTPAPATVEYYPAEVMDMRIFGSARHRRYLVRWQGYDDPKEWTWQTPHSLRRHRHLIQRYHDSTTRAQRRTVEPRRSARISARDDTIRVEANAVSLHNGGVFHPQSTSLTFTCTIPRGASPLKGNRVWTQHPTNGQQGVGSRRAALTRSRRRTDNQSARSTN